jgi:hypothetical protein
VCPFPPGGPALKGKALALRVNNVPSVSVLDPSANQCAEQGYAYTFSEQTLIQIRLDANGALTGTVGPSLSVSLDAGPDQPIQYVGFTAGTGDDYAEFYVEDLHLTVCP